MTSKYYEMLENAPEYAKETAALFSWSSSYDSGSMPSQLFLDLTGILTEDLGCDLFTWSPMSDALGYLELSMLADALKEYATSPQAVEEWVTELINAESPEEEELA